MEGNKNNLIPKDHVAVMLEKIDGKFDLLAEDLASVKETVGLLAEDMDQVKSDIFDMKRDIREMKVELKMKADKEVVESHETRLGKLENLALAE